MTFFFGATVQEMNLDQLVVRGASTRRRCYGIDMYMRIITPDHRLTVLDWRRVRAIVLPKLPHDVRVSPKDLESNLFTCITPHTLNLYVGDNKSQLFRIVPANP
jgi:hypothetical protein